MGELSRVAHEWVMSRINVSCHMGMRHGTPSCDSFKWHEWIICYVIWMSHMDEFNGAYSYYMNMSCLSAMAHMTWMCHVTWVSAVYIHNAIHFCLNHSNAHKYRIFAHTQKCKLRLFLTNSNVIHRHTYTQTHTHAHNNIQTPTQFYTPTYKSASYGVASISRLLKIISLFCKRAL